MHSCYTSSSLINIVGKGYKGQKLSSSSGESLCATCGKLLPSGHKKHRCHPERLSLNLSSNISSPVKDKLASKRIRQIAQSQSKSGDATGPITLPGISSKPLNLEVNPKLSEKRQASVQDLGDIQRDLNLSGRQSSALSKSLRKVYGHTGN